MRRRLWRHTERAGDTGTDQGEQQSVPLSAVDCDPWVPPGVFLPLVSWRDPGEAVLLARNTAAATDRAAAPSRMKRVCRSLRRAAVMPRRVASTRAATLLDTTPACPPAIPACTV